MNMTNHPGKTDDQLRGRYFRAARCRFFCRRPTVPRLVAHCFVVLAVLAFLPACGALGPAPHQPLVIGEHVAYRVVNIGSQVPQLELPRLVDASNGQLLYANLLAFTESPTQPRLHTSDGRLDISRLTLPPLYGGRRFFRGMQAFEKDPGNENLVLPRVSVGAFAVSPRGHRVPDTIALSWRRLPVPGESVFGGAPVGPLTVKLRNAIPAEVLARVRDQWRYRLDIEVAVSDDQPVVRWRVLNFTDDAVHEVQRGGYWTL